MRSCRRDPSEVLKDDAVATADLKELFDPNRSPNSTLAVALTLAPNP